MVDINLFAKNKKKRIGNPNDDSEDIQWGYRDGICHRKMCHTNLEKRETRNDGGNRTTELRKKLGHRRIGDLQIHGKIGSGHPQIRGNVRELITQGNEETSPN